MEPTQATMRFFLYDGVRIMALIPNSYSGGACYVWAHHEDGKITRDEVVPEALPLLEELSEEDARQVDPVMFRECLDAPYADAPTMIAFYQQRYKEEMEYIQENPLSADQGPQEVPKPEA